MRLFREDAILVMFAIFKQDDINAVKGLARCGGINNENFDEFLEWAQKEKAVECITFLLEYGHAHNLHGEREDLEL